MSNNPMFDRMQQLMEATAQEKPGLLSIRLPASADAAAKASVLDALRVLGGDIVAEDAIEFSGTKVVLPEQFSGNVRAGIRFLEEHITQQEQEHLFKRAFPFLLDDVAYAFMQTLKAVFGTSGNGVTVQTMFGPIPPEFRTINVSPTETAQVPGNKFAIPSLNAEGGVVNDGHGHGLVRIEAPRKYRAQIEGLFIAMEEYLRRSSIYRGRAITGAAQPEFLPTDRIDPTKVVYSDTVMEELNVHLWTPIRHTELLRKVGQPIKRSILLFGNYGTGKSLAGYLTAQEATAHGWTFLFVRPQDDLNRAMETAKLYAPAVVFFEDIDVVADESSPEKISKLLDTFDGLGGKGTEIVAVLTTNHVDKIHRGMLRPGRMDAVIEIGELDASGIQKLIAGKLPAASLGNIDYTKIATAVSGYTPAFVAEAVDRAFRYALVRNGDDLSLLHTNDFVSAAGGLRQQFDLMTGAHEGKAVPTIDGLFKGAVADVLEHTHVYDSDGDASYYHRKMTVQDTKPTTHKDEDA